MNAVKEHPNGTCDTNALASLLRYELSAVETYDDALTKFENHHALADLHQIREHHGHAVVLLREQMDKFGGEQVESPGPWSCFEAAVKGGAHALGFAALKQGEQHAINEYELALNNEDVNPECKVMIRAELLPHDKENLEKLDRLMGGMS